MSKPESSRTREICQMSDIDIAELRRLLAEASPGPWEYDGVPVDDSHWTVAEIARGAPLPMIEVPGSEAKDANADAALIVALRNAAPELLDRLERAEEERDELARKLVIATNALEEIYEYGPQLAETEAPVTARKALAQIDGDSEDK